MESFLTLADGRVIGILPLSHYQEDSEEERRVLNEEEIAERLELINQINTDVLKDLVNRLTNVNVHAIARDRTRARKRSLCLPKKFGRANLIKILKDNDDDVKLDDLRLAVAYQEHLNAERKIAKEARVKLRENSTSAQDVEGTAGDLNPKREFRVGDRVVHSDLHWLNVQHARRHVNHLTFGIVKDVRPNCALVDIVGKIHRGSTPVEGDPRLHVYFHRAIPEWNNIESESVLLGYGSKSTPRMKLYDENREYLEIPMIYERSVRGQIVEDIRFF